MTRTLYQLDGCPWCEKVADRMDELALDYDTVWVDAMHSARDEVKRVSGQRAVPVLADEAHAVTMNESANIVDYLDATYADE